MSCYRAYLNRFGGDSFIWMTTAGWEENGEPQMAKIGSAPTAGTKKKSSGAVEA